MTCDLASPWTNEQNILLMDLVKKISGRMGVAAVDVIELSPENPFWEDVEEAWETEQKAKGTYTIGSAAYWHVPNRDALALASQFLALKK